MSDPSMPGMEWMDSYDAVLASVAADKASFKLVRVLHSWKELMELVMSCSNKERLDVLVVGNWVHDGVVKHKKTVSVLLELFRAFEMTTGCRVFPPLDYAVYFARKELYYSDLERAFRLHDEVKTIPTLFLPMPPLPLDWKERLRCFAESEGSADRGLVFK